MFDPFKDSTYTMMNLKQAERFWHYVQTCAHDDECRACCWEWQGATKRHYGHYVTETKREGRHAYGTHRLAFLFAYGEVPGDVCVLHRCDNPPCCNPAHLWIGTHADTVADRHRKGHTAFGERHGLTLYPERRARGERHKSRTHPESLPCGDRNGSRIHPERLPRGEQNGNARLTASQVLEIRALRGKALKREIAQQFGVTRALVGYIHARKIWTHLPEEPSP